MHTHTQTLNRIGLDHDQAALLANKLNILLAHYTVFYQNTRGYHWNLKGEKFFELHLKFEELYNDLQVKIDELAERVLTLGHTPYHTFDDFQANSGIEPTPNVTNGFTAVNHILDSFEQLLVLQRELLDLSDAAADEGTNALMSDYIREQEKLVWMYSAFAG
ncbi:MAG: Dps family protein [Bacteroidota bacterium]